MARKVNEEEKRINFRTSLKKKDLDAFDAKIAAINKIYPFGAFDRRSVIEGLILNFINEDDKK